MLNYYKEGLETSKKQLELAKLGYKQVLEELGKSLAEAKSVEESELIIDKIRASRKAISELEGTVAHNQKKYDEEYNKPENVAARAKETLFGGKNNG